MDESIQMFCSDEECAIVIVLAIVLKIVLKLVLVLVLVLVLDYAKSMLSISISVMLDLFAWGIKAYYPKNGLKEDEL